jgi:hypothetical protein
MRHWIEAGGQSFDGGSSGEMLARGQHPIVFADAAHYGGAVEEYDLVTDVLRAIMEALRWRYGCARLVDAMHVVLAAWGSQSWAVTDNLLQAGRRWAGEGPELMRHSVGLGGRLRSGSGGIIGSGWAPVKATQLSLGEKKVTVDG